MTELVTRLAAACPGWRAAWTDDGWLLTLPCGDTATIATDAAFAAWLERRETTMQSDEAAQQTRLFEEAAA